MHDRRPNHASIGHVALGVFALKTNTIKALQSTSRFMSELGARHSRLVELISAPAQDRRPYTTIRSFQRVVVTAESKPVSVTTLRVDTTVTADFSYNTPLGSCSTSSRQRRAHPQRSLLLKQELLDEHKSRTLPLVSRPAPVRPHRERRVTPVHGCCANLPRDDSVTPRPSAQAL